MKIKNSGIAVIIFGTLALLLGLNACNPLSAGKPKATSAPNTDFRTPLTSGALAPTLEPSENPYAPPPGMRLPAYADFLTLKYDAAGAQVWAKLYEFSKESRNYPAALNLDMSYGLYVTGTSFSKSGDLNSIATIKYDTGGTLLSSVSFDNKNPPPNNGIFARASIVDDFGNIYVAGSTSEPGQTLLVLLKYDGGGNRVWVKTYRYPSSVFSDSSDIALDKAGNIYVTGSFSLSRDSNGSDFLTLKFNNGGDLLWVSTYDGPAHGMDIAFKIGVDDHGNVFVTGESIQSGQFNFDYATIKYDSSGHELWVDSYDGPGGNLDIPHNLKVDLQGNVYVTGESDGLGNIREYATIKYSNDGRQLWLRRYAGSSTANATPSAMAIDSAGNIYITGTGSGRPNGSHYATVKYDSDGEQLWASEYNGTGSGLNEASGIFVDETGFTYVTGKCWIDSQYATFDTVKYDPAGKQLWSAKFNKVLFMDRPTGIVVDKTGNVFITGQVSSYDPFD